MPSILLKRQKYLAPYRAYWLNRPWYLVFGENSAAMKIHTECLKRQKYSTFKYCNNSYKDVDNLLTVFYLHETNAEILKGKTYTCLLSRAGIVCYTSTVLQSIIDATPRTVFTGSSERLNSGNTCVESLDHLKWICKLLELKKELAVCLCLTVSLYVG